MNISPLFFHANGNELTGHTENFHHRHAIRVTKETWYIKANLDSVHSVRLPDEDSNIDAENTTI